MSGNRLYIIGNGFDRHHGLPCGYADFRAWLQGNKADAFRKLNRIYGECKSDKWSDFEANLVSFNMVDYPDDVSRADLMKLKTDLQVAYREWSKSIRTPGPESIIDDIDRSALFFTFNYTRTLEDLYGIDEDRIVYLHGSVDNGSLVFGNDSMGDGVSDYALENACEIGMDADLYLDMVHVKMSQEFADEFRKPVAKIIEKHRYDIESLAGIEEMIVLGFSYSKIDMPYLERIIEVIGDDIKVTFGYHTMEDANNASACAAALGLGYCKLVEF